MGFRGEVCSWLPLANVGWALRPTAQSGRGGKGCCEDAVDVYVRRELDDVVVEDDVVESPSSLYEDALELPPLKFD